MTSSLAILWVALSVSAQERGVDVHVEEQAQHAFPVVRDLTGTALGVANVAQWVRGATLHVRSDMRLRGGTHVSERASFSLGNRMQQLDWKWEERRNGVVLRRFSVDFQTGVATAMKLDEQGKREAWREELGNINGAFAGFGFMYAAKNLRDRLQRGETIELIGVGFTPTPRTSKVTLRSEGVVDIPIGGRPRKALRVILHPEIPVIAKLFVRVPDVIMHLSTTTTPELLRAEMPLIEPSDAVVRIEAAQ